MQNKKVIILVLIVLALGSYWYFSSRQSEQQMSLPSEIGGRIGQTISPFTLENLEGAKVTVGTPGKITVINFWATWCPPCQEEMPDLEKFAKRNQEKVNFYAVNLQESESKIKKFMNEKQYTMPVLLDKDGVVGKHFQVTAIPTTIIINKHGMVKYRKSGPMTIHELEGIINSL